MELATTTDLLENISAAMVRLLHDRSEDAKDDEKRLETELQVHLTCLVLRPCHAASRKNWRAHRLL